MKQLGGRGIWFFASGEGLVAANFLRFDDSVLGSADLLRFAPERSGQGGIEATKTNDFSDLS